VSLQFIGRMFDEPRLLAIAAQCERAIAFQGMPPLLGS
jgi:Asp-tRNA(Asn)/Glu-tRNA(Gln) amidotransferase A subunit family amidase